MPDDTRTTELRKIRDEIVALTSSPLYEFRTKNKYHPVIGEGSHYAKIMFVGEAPGKNEAESGRPFCGASGRVLDELLLSVGIRRSDVYITNIVKDRPPENRDPTTEEIVAYGSFLDRQIQIIKPSAIATLGRYSMDYIMRRFGLEWYIEPIGKAHGKAYDAKDSFGCELKIIPLYHPAVAIYNSNTKETLRKDFTILKTLR